MIGALILEAVRGEHKSEYVDDIIVRIKDLWDGARIAQHVEVACNFFGIEMSEEKLRFICEENEDNDTLKDIVKFF